MNILVVGSGGREHAVCRALAKSKIDSKIFCCPGNAGIMEIAAGKNISATDIPNLLNFALENQIDLTVVGGESSLEAGIVDEFEKHQLRIVGANKYAARLESSKVFAKDFMFRHNIPTAKYQNAESPEKALEILHSGAFGDENTSVVVKADGLAAGKGVVVVPNRAEAETAIENMMVKGSVGRAAAQKVVLEETLTGREISLLLFADGKNFVLMPPARDHKRIGEGDTGANTGGMGVITDNQLLSEKQIAEIINKIIKPTLAGAEKEGFPFRGILFLGLMMTDSGAKLLEYNVRFGDPEAQAILVRLESDFVEICEAIIDGNLAETEVKFSEKSSACVIMASRGYPYTPETGAVIHGLENVDLPKDVVIFHGATAKNKNGEFITNGGRVLGVTATGDDLTQALEKSYAAVSQITWDGVQFRRDIGK
jgi:phosphoribosylamine--glycine ligase